MPQRIAIVTGAARGIGAGTAKRLAADGMAVGVLDLHEDDGAQTVAEIEKAGGRAIAVGADVSDADQVTAAVEKVAAELGEPTVLVNNAGVTRDNLLFKMDEADWDTVMNVHLKGAFLMSRASQKYMVAAKWGRIVNLSSTVRGRQPRPGQLLHGQGGPAGPHQDPRARAGQVRHHRERGRARLRRHRHDRRHRGPPRHLLRGLPGRRGQGRSRCSGSARSRTSPTRSRSSPVRGPASSPARSSTCPAARSRSKPGQLARSPSARPTRKGAQALSDTPAAARADLRAAVRAFCAEHDPAATPRAAFLSARFDAGLAAVHYPVGHGGLGLPRALQAVGEEEFARAGAPRLDERRNVIGLGMAAPTIIAFGSDEQKSPGGSSRSGSADEIWCQLFSEPGAGSDLAGLATRAVRDGDDWVVNGQKVWTSLAHHARWALLLARTDPDVPKHPGLSYFIVDMHAPGVEVRPLRQLTGEAEFNEVFLTDVARPRREPARRGRRGLEGRQRHADERAGLDRQRDRDAPRVRRDRLRRDRLAPAPGAAHARPAPAAAVAVGAGRGRPAGGRAAAPADRRGPARARRARPPSSPSPASTRRSPGSRSSSSARTG